MKSLVRINKTKQTIKLNQIKYCFIVNLEKGKPENINSFNAKCQHDSQLNPQKLTTITD